MHGMSDPLVTTVVVLYIVQKKSFGANYCCITCEQRVLFIPLFVLLSVFLVLV